MSRCDFCGEELPAGLGVMQHMQGHAAQLQQLRDSMKPGQQAPQLPAAAAPPVAGVDEQARKFIATLGECKWCHCVVPTASIEEHKKFCLAFQAHERQRQLEEERERAERERLARVDADNAELRAKVAALQVAIAELREPTRDAGTSGASSREP